MLNRHRNERRQRSNGLSPTPLTHVSARDCGAPGEINNGWRDPGYRFTYPTRVTYHCNEGYELRGRGYRECQANGEWSGVLPDCERKSVLCVESFSTVNVSQCLCVESFPTVKVSQCCV